MRTPTDLELEHLAHIGVGGAVSAYDPVKAHEYYLRTRKLHPRKKGVQPEGFARANAQRHEGAKAKQKRELQAHITGLQKKLNELEQLIRTKEAALKRSQSSNAKKNRAKPKPKTAADKAKEARDAKKYRNKHKQELKTKAKQASNKSGGSSSKTPAKKPREMPIADLKALATKVKGQLAVAKQKLAAL